MASAGPTFEEAVARGSAPRSRPVPAEALEVPGFRRAGVLVPLLARADGPTLLFTRRTDTVPHHKGEMSFPGGGAAEGESRRRAALREAEEEVGLAASRVEILGAQDDVPSIARYVVTPVAAAVRPRPFAFVPRRSSRSRSRSSSRSPVSSTHRSAAPRSGIPRVCPPRSPRALLASRIPFEEVDPGDRASGACGRSTPIPARVVWGLTARILSDLLDRAFGPPQAGDPTARRRGRRRPAIPTGHRRRAIPTARRRRAI